jgi:hypothetical protein
MSLRVSYRKKYEEKKFPLHHCRKEPDPDPLVRGTDPDLHQNATDP